MIRWISTAAAGWLIGTAGCATEEASTQTPPPPCVETQTVELGLLQPELWAYDETIRGLDLDGHDSERADEVGCYLEDPFDPDGSRVDAQSTELALTLSAFYGVDERSFFWGSRFELTMEPVGDEEGVCAGVAFSLPGGPRRIAEWNGSTLRAYDLGIVPLLVRLPGVQEIVLLRDAAVRVEVEGGRIASVILGGALDIDELVPIGRAAEPRYREASIRFTMELLADLRPNAEGECQEISVAIEALP